MKRILLSLATLGIGLVAALGAATAAIAEALRFTRVYELSEPFHKRALFLHRRLRGAPDLGRSGLLAADRAPSLCRPAQR
jgi:hypothetical protein